MKSLKNLRKAKGVKQRDVADYLGVSPQAYSTYETGTRQPNIDILTKLAEYFGITTDELLEVGVEKSEPGWKTVDPEKFPPKPPVLPLPDLFHTVRIPILGSVRAGFDWLAQQEVVGWVEVEEDLVERFPDVFALYVKGDSMEPEIRHNDIAICIPRSQVDNGSIAIICINGDEGTIKRVRFDCEGITVIPSNKAYPPRHYSPEEVETTPITIQALVIETRRKYI